MTSPNQENRTRHWRSVEELLEPEVVAQWEREFPEGADVLEVDGVNRRTFLGLMGASAALAGASVSGCLPRKEVEHIVPYAKRPEEIIPGEPLYYASAFQAGVMVQGLLVECHDGRPTKIEGNPEHSASLGGASCWAQASLLGLYDPDRSGRPQRNTAKGFEDISPDDFLAGFDAKLAEAKAAKGAGFGLVVSTPMSPTVVTQLLALKKLMPQARFFLSDGAFPRQTAAGATLAGMAHCLPIYSFDKAKVVATFDSDFLGVEGEIVRSNKGFAKGRDLLVTAPGQAQAAASKMNRLYVVEPGFSPTGAMADHRLRMSGADVGATLVALAEALGSQGVKVAVPASGALAGLDEKRKAFVTALAEDLAAAKSGGLVVVGERQPAWAHALGHAINEAIGARGTTVSFTKLPILAELEGLDALAQAASSKELTTLITLDANPVFDATGDLGMAAAIGAVATLIHCGSHIDETARAGAATLHMPTSDRLESWGDLASLDGEVAIVQPMLEPLFGTPSVLELLFRLVSGTAKNGYDIVREHWSKQVTDLSDKQWRKWLHAGVASAAGVKVPAAPDAGTPSFGAVKVAPTQASGIELGFHLSSHLLDGRYANNGWMHETPDSITKLTWDNAALMSKATADQLKVKSRDLVKVSANGAEATLAAFVVPGIADSTVQLPIGFGRQNLGVVASGADYGGTDVNPLRTWASPWIANGGSVTKAGGTYKLATTQDHGRLEATPDAKPRPLVRESSVADFASNPTFVLDKELLPAEKVKSLSPRDDQNAEMRYDEATGKYGRQQWGMAIDLTKCTGCNACLVACGAENNIPIAGKDRIEMGREMHWIRLDRYFTGDYDNPGAVVQPVPCMHCEAAPCETVCPVGATAHSPDGLNDMVYNRCVGTRYCSNNCPYKVRRFNWLNLNLDLHPLEKMHKNPDVSLRFRGVMEKCSYCVQRINQAKIDAKVEGSGLVPEGGILTACQQTCPADAITFGNIANASSAVAQKKADVRNYALLADLANRPRTTYTAKIRNPNPKLG